MTKTKLQQELKEKVKPGIKPSQLKRSKSAETLPLPPTPPLTKSKSAETLPLPQPSLSDQIKQLKQELVFSQTTASNYLTNLRQVTAELDNLKETANVKIEKANERVKKYQAKVSELGATNNQLIDQNNELRLQALKDFDQHRENQQGIEQAVEKLVNTEQTQINYQVQNGILLREKKDLEKRLQTANERIQKLYQLKGLPHQAPAPFTLPWKTLLLTSLVVATIILLRP